MTAALARAGTPAPTPAANPSASSAPAVSVSLAKPPPERSSRLLATSGLFGIDGAVGGGLTPWALIAGYGTDGQVGAVCGITHIGTGDVQLDQTGAAVGLSDRLELSVANQHGTILKRTRLGQSVLGLKLRLCGDAVYDQDTWKPQVAFGVQFKDADGAAFVKSLGARDDKGTDFYLSATKFLLAQRLLLNGTVRATRANHLGLLGFGTTASDSYRLELEGSLAYMLNRRTAIGLEYRGKPNRLVLVREEDWKDIFVAFYPRKSVQLTLGFADLGNIAAFGEQQGLYTALQVDF